ncbi:MAG TPA: hypothetical protein VKR79_02195 [Gaiellaceae bacterium]|nr:hypothetical protein [Gaiellaceae bacterium]
MATRGQTHNKRARELALKEKRERKQLKKEERAAGIFPADEGDSYGNLNAPTPEEQPETAPEPIQ